MSEQNQSENYQEFEYESDVDGTERGEDAGQYSQSNATTGGLEEGVVEEEQEQEQELFSRLGDSSDDPEQKRRYLEYLGLIKEIECQNQMVEDIKTQIMEQCAKPCKTKCEIKDIKRLRTCMEQEVLKLRCLMNKAMQLQNFGSRRRWQEIPIATTIDEDNMTPYVGCIPAQKTNWKGGDSSEPEKSSCQDNKAANEKVLQCLCKTMGKMKICCPEDKKLLQEIVQAFLCQKKKQQKQEPPCRHKAPQRTAWKSRSMQMENGLPSDEAIDRLKQKIMYMQVSVNKLKQEICKREKEREKAQRECEQEKEQDDCMEEQDPTQLCLGKRTTKSDQINKLKENYLHLLTEFAKKDCQLKELEKRLKGFCGSCGGAGGGGGGNNGMENAEQSELALLRVRVTEMKEEQVEFKCIMKEQSQQLEDYRNKYLTAQQKVEEQCVTLEKLNMNNKRIEKQINTEVKEIRAKFQEKLNELLHFPKLLENEQLKLSQVCKEKDELHGKLMLVCKELKALKLQTESPKENNDCRPQLMKCQMALSTLQTKAEDLERQRDLFCEQLKTTQDDLDTLRSESAKIIARTKERAEMTRQQMQEQIDRLEKELAQCRATACLSVSDREAVIREMQGQLNTLSYSFDAAQKQIKTLRNHIAYVSNENCFPVKC